MSSDALRSPGPTLLTLIAITMALAVAAAAGLAKDSDPDPGFGVGGRVIADVSEFDDLPLSMAIDGQGRIVVAGVSVMPPGRAWPVVARFDPDGSLDQSFGRDGVAKPPAPSGWSTAPALAIDEAGRILLGGSTEEAELVRDFMVLRLLENGRPDTGFDGDGVLTVDTGSWNDLAFDLALDPHGGILLSGSTTVGFEPRLAVVGITPAGALDSGFGEGGIALADFEGMSEGRALAVDSRGRVIVAGGAWIDGEREFVLAAFDARGRPDPGFGEGGWERIDVDPRSTVETANDVTLDQRGRLIVVGEDTATIALAVRLSPDGSPDGSFGGDGKVVLPAGANARVTGAAIDRAGRVLVVGSAETRIARRSAFLIRLGEDGLLDGSFGTRGFVWEDFSTYAASGEDLAVDAAGRYLLTAAVSYRGVSFGVARYANVEPPPEPGQAPRCRGKRATIVGTGRANRLRGTRGRDVIVALGDDDRIRSFAGKDLICAGRGRDLVRAGKGNDRVFGGPGNDKLFGGPGKDRLRGGPGRDVER